MPSKNTSLLLVGAMAIGVASLGIVTGAHQQHRQQLEKTALVSVASDQHDADLARITALEAELAHLREDNATLSKQVADATTAARRAREAAASSRASRSRPIPPRSSTPTSTGCGSNWQASLGADERWIYERESGMDPHNVNPSSGAFGLGQLLASTYADLGMSMSSDPCSEIAAARAYMRARYGSWSNARGFWEAHSWW